MAYVYRHIRKDRDEVFYIGISRRDDKSFSRAHCFNAKNRNNFWIRVFNKTEIEVEIMLSEITYEEAKEKEKEFIALYGRRKDGGTLVNLTLGGDGVLGVKNNKLAERNKQGIWRGKRHSEETKLLMSNKMKGLKRTPETSKKLSKLMRGKWPGKLNPNYKGPVSVFKDDKLIGVYDFPAEAGAAVGVSYASTVACLAGTKENIRGYQFKRL